MNPGPLGLRAARWWARMREALHPRRFGTQIALGVLALAVVNVAVVGAYIGNRFITQQTTDTGHRFEAVADNLSLGAAPLVITHDYGALDQMLDAAARFPGVRTLAVTDARGHVLSRVDRSRGGAAQVSFTYGFLSTPPGSAARLRWLDGRGHAATAGWFTIPRGIEIWYPIESGRLGWLYAHASVSEIRNEAALLARDSLMVLLLLTLSGVGMLFALLRPRVSALARATEFARRLGRADARALAVYPGTLELEVLGRTLNETSLKLLRQDAAVRAQQVRIEAIVENLADGVVLTDARGDVLSANSAFCAMFGHAREQLPGSNLSRFIPALDASDLARYCAGQARTHEIQGLRADGVELPLALGMNSFDIDGQVFYVGAVHDLRERNRWIAELRDTRDAALAASRAKSDFLAAMSHEIRTPMNGIIGMLDLLLQSSLNEQQARMAEISRRSALALLDIINDILDLAKIEAGKLSILDEPLELEPLVQEVALLFDQLAQKKGIELSAWVDPSLPLNLRGDALRIRQLLSNLLSNAVKFTDGNERRGCVCLRAESCPEAPLQQWCLSVRDNGIGIQPQVLQRLFLPFEQADNYTTKRFGGTGLGLSICHHLVEMMGGRIEVRSTPGEGSEFRILLPLRVDGAPRANQSRALLGQVCAVVGEPSQHTQDLLACLSASGAQALRVDHAGQVPPQAAVLWLAQPVALAHQAPWQLVLGEGRRREPRLLSPGLAQIDANLLSRTLLERAALLAMHGHDAQAEAQAPSPAHHPDGELRDRRDAQRRGRLVLVAEDNETNQQVIRLQLQRLGLWADMVGDGEQALHRWQQEAYALVLSDLHMPRMDGFDLARALRAQEARLGRARTPLVALTAAAQPQELQRAMASGMDAYMTKPVSMDTMRETLRRFVPALAAPTVAPPAPAASADFDPLALRRLVGDDEATLRALRQQYEQELRRALPELQGLRDATQPEQLAQAAHRLKSSSRAAGALALADMLERIEAAARNRQDEQLEGAVRALPALAQRVLQALADQA
jgi:PAS domain S-box-containing protein